MIRKLVIFIALLFPCLNVFADPEPLGIKLNKDNLEDVKRKYKIISSEINATEGYYNNFLEVKNIDIETISKVNVISNEAQIVEGVILILGQSQFNKIYEALSNKYKLLSSDIPFVGNKYAKFQDGECYIIFTASHMSFEMQVIYVTKNFTDKFKARLEEEEAHKDEQRKKML